MNLSKLYVKRLFGLYDYSIDFSRKDVNVLDANGESISHKVVNNVPLKRNRITMLSGSLYTTSGTGSFTVTTDWLEGNNVPF